MHKGPLPGGGKPISSREAADLVARANDLQRGLVTEAERLYRQVVAAGKMQFEAFYLVGLIEAQRGNLDEGHRLLRDAVKLAPRSVKAHVNFGRVLNLLDRHEQALASYDKALAIDPHFVLAWNNRSATLRKLNRLEDALASFDRALAISPGAGDALFHMEAALTGLWERWQRGESPRGFNVEAVA